jgi:beta-1,4-mannosyltransferase
MASIRLQGVGDVANYPQTVRVDVWPPNVGRGANPYISLFQSAMAGYGVEYDERMDPFDFSATPDVIPGDAIHFHWGLEDLWRHPGRSPTKGLGAMRRFRSRILMLKNTGARLIWTIHNLVPHERAGWQNAIWDWAAYRFFARQADVGVFHSERAKREFRCRFGLLPRTCVVMPFGNYDGCYPSPSRRDATRARLGIPNDRRLLLCCGYIRGYKGLETALEAVGTLGEPYYLIIAGSPVDESLVAKLVSGSRKFRNVVVLPRELSEQEVADLYEASDCAVLPYLRITGSSAIVAAATFGRGVIVSDLGFFKDSLAEEPRMGVMFRAGSVSEMRRSISEYFEVSADLRGISARRWADRYCWNQVVSPVAEAVKGVCLKARDLRSVGSSR